MFDVLRPCTYTGPGGCSKLVPSGRCDAHPYELTETQKEEQRYRRSALDAHRGSARKRGYTTAWGKARNAHLSAHPLCVHCGARGRTAGAAIVDHVIPHKGDVRLFWMEENWQGLCVPCDGAKKPREAGLVPCEHGHYKAIDGRVVCILCGREAQR